MKSRGMEGRGMEGFSTIKNSLGVCGELRVKGRKCEMHLFILMKLLL